MKLTLLTIATLSVLSGVATAKDTVSKKSLLKKSTVISQTKKKEPNGCKAFGNAVRNIRTVKEMQREMNNHDDETIKACMQQFKSDPKMMHLFKEWAKLNRS